MDRELSGVLSPKLEYHKKEMNKIMNSKGVLMFQKKHNVLFCKRYQWSYLISLIIQ